MLGGARNAAAERIFKSIIFSPAAALGTTKKIIS